MGRVLALAVLCAVATCMMGDGEVTPETPCVSNKKAEVLRAYHSLWVHRHPHAHRQEVQRRMALLDERLARRCPDEVGETMREAAGASEAGAAPASLVGQGGGQGAIARSAVGSVGVPPRDEEGAMEMAGTPNVLDLARCLSTCANKSRADLCRAAYTPEVSTLDPPWSLSRGMCILWYARSSAGRLASHLMPTLRASH